MIELSAKLKRPLPTPLYLALCAVATAFVVLTSSKALGRAPWIDEAMLFDNYPISGIFASIKPLPLYDQAATPLYSILYGWTAALPIEAIRGIHFATLLFSPIAILSWRSKSGLAVASALLATTAFPASVYYMLELKHYGLEAIGALGIMAWYMNRDLNKKFGLLDFILVSSLSLLGISTLPVAGVALGLFFARKLIATRKIIRSEALWASATLAILIIHYGIIKHITIFQLSNYPGPYEYIGFIDSIQQYAKAVAGLMPSGKIGGIGLAVLFLFLMIEARKNPRIRNLLVISAVTAIGIALLAGINIYPIRSTRHVIWASSACWLILYESCMLLLTQERFTKAKAPKLTIKSDILTSFGSTFTRFFATTAQASTLCLFAFSSFLNISAYANTSPPIDTQLAIEYLRKSPIQDVVLYGGAQAVKGFYSKRYTDLTSKRYYGEMQSESVIALPPDSLKLESLSVSINKPGAYSRFWHRKADRDKVLQEVIESAPKNRDLILLGNSTGTLNDERRKILLDNGCQIKEHNHFGSSYASIVKCAQ